MVIYRVFGEEEKKPAPLEVDAQVGDGTVSNFRINGVAVLWLSKEGIAYRRYLSVVEMAKLPGIQFDRDRIKIGK